MTEAVRCVVDFARECLDLPRLEIRCSTLNGRSARVAERCGFSLDRTETFVLRPRAFSVNVYSLQLRAATE
jgi:RimJ/RimL family protein N-acetyltransferase